MADIIWTSYQQNHITKRHNITAEEFEEAWEDRDTYFEGEDYIYGIYYESVGCTNDRTLILVWRWQDDDVWPITAYSEEE